MTQIVNVPVLLPHEAFQKVWDSGSFQRTICAGPHVLESFWKEISDHPAVRNHPVRNIDGFERRAVPLLLHGDGAAVTQQIGSGSKSCLFLSWKSMVGNSKDTKDAHILIGAIWSHLCVSTSHFDTSKSFWKVVSKSFNFMLNSAGDTTGGFFGCLLFTTGDLEYYNSFLGQARWNANFPCPLCNVHLSNVGNFRSVTDVSVDQWDSLPRQGQSCPLFHSLLSPLAICPDWMHSKHLGTDQRLLGSVAWVLLFEVDAEGPLEQRLFNLLEELKETQFQHNNYFVLF